MRYHTQEHRHSVSALSWSHDSALLLSGSYDHTVRQWDVSARRFPTSGSVAPAPCLLTLPPHPASPTLVWQVKAGSCVATWTTPDNAFVQDVAFHPSGGGIQTLVAAAFATCSIRHITPA